MYNPELETDSYSYKALRPIVGYAKVITIRVPQWLAIVIVA